MGWRAQDAYEKAARDRWRALPVREQYQGIALRLALLTAIVGLLLWTGLAR